MRIALGLEYDGRAFRGWQVQENTRTVQASVEAALARIAGHDLRVHCAGRTDAGVHACGQVVHFETDVQRPLRAWVLGANVHLPEDVAVLWAVPVEDDFHARFSATGRVYRYLILNRPSRPALFRGRAAWECRPLDAAAMGDAARHLLGEHDFSSFRAVGCQAKHPVRELRRLEVSRQGQWVCLEAEANGFLHHMVRNIAGVLMAVGAGKRPSDWVREVLERRDRRLGGVTAPADGLYLTRVEYPRRFALPEPRPSPLP